MMAGLSVPARFYPGAFDDPRYRGSHPEASRPASDDRRVGGPPAAQLATRIAALVVVRRDELAVYEYLSMRCRGLKGVEVKLDQRQVGSAQPADDRRNPRQRFNVFGVQVVRRRPTVS